MMASAWRRSWRRSGINATHAAGIDWLSQRPHSTAPTGRPAAGSRSLRSRTVKRAPACWEHFGAGELEPQADGRAMKRVSEIRFGSPARRRID